MAMQPYLCDCGKWHLWNTITSRSVNLMPGKGYKCDNLLSCDTEDRAKILGGYLAKVSPERRERQREYAIRRNARNARQGG